MRAARGTVINRGTTYSVVLDIGRDEDGKRLRRWHSGYQTKKAAEQGGPSCSAVSMREPTSSRTSSPWASS